MRNFLTLKISYKSSSDWLQLAFHFGTENMAKHSHPVKYKPDPLIAIGFIAVLVDAETDSRGWVECGLCHLLDHLTTTMCVGF